MFALKSTKNALVHITLLMETMKSEQHTLHRTFGVLVHRDTGAVELI